jgi:hypothetical protein
MKLFRRKFLRLARCCPPRRVAHRMGASLSDAAGAHRVGFAPAGPGDIVARLIGQWLSERLWQPFITEHWPGAGGNIGTEAVVRAPAPTRVETKQQCWCRKRLHPPRRRQESVGGPFPSPVALT